MVAGCRHIRFLGQLIIENVFYIVCTIYASMVSVIVSTSCLLVKLLITCEYAQKSWALFATKGAIFQTHVDVAGFATTLRIKFGWKILGVMLEPSLPSANGWDDHPNLWWHAVISGPEENL